MRPSIRLRVCTLWLAAWMMMDAAQASVSLSGTRLVFDGRYREATLQVSNHGAHEVLIQAWLSAPEDDDDTPLLERRALPFVVMPHLHRLAAGGRETLRVLYQGEGMPAERESVLHLYVTQVPRRREGLNQLNIAIRQRINLFYRPPGLKGDPAAAAQALSWAYAALNETGHALEVSNPTPYHVSVQSLSLGGFVLDEFLLLAPGARHRWPVAPLADAPPLTFQALTDYGGARDYCALLQAGKATHARLLDSTQIKDKC